MKKVHAEQSESSTGRVVLVGRSGYSTKVVASALLARFPHATLIIEDPIPTGVQIRSRFRRLGFRRGFGQLLFRALSPLLSIPQRARRKAIRRELATVDDEQVRNAISVTSVNSARARQLLKKLDPDVVVINGTRIVGSKTLRCAPIFINMHAGITPQYRGVHGGYWAVATGDEENFGVTVHRVDEGVDTGQVISQIRTRPEAMDGFFTYPLVQLKLGLPSLVGAVASALEGRLVSDNMPAGSGADNSQQWYHPTLYEYIRIGITRGVW